MTNEEGSNFLERVINISDVVVLSNSSSFNELENEKSMPNGSIIRQSLRLAFTYAVKNCLEFRKRLNSTNVNTRRTSSTSTPLSVYLDEAKLISNKDPIEALLDYQLSDHDAEVIYICI